MKSSGVGTLGCLFADDAFAARAAGQTANSPHASPSAAQPASPAIQSQPKQPRSGATYTLTPERRAKAIAYFTVALRPLLSRNINFAGHLYSALACRPRRCVP